MVLAVAVVVAAVAVVVAVAVVIVVVVVASLQSLLIVTNENTSNSGFWQKNDLWLVVSCCC